MNAADTVSNLSALTQQLLTYWIVPAGMLALYFYGRFHFNTPDYALELNDEAGRPLAEPGRLITLAPPIFTTSRSRFDRFAFRYILILEALFLVAIFLPSLLSDAGRILALKPPVPPTSETLQYRALFALFALTGLLSSFPLLKELDGWILKRLHGAAFIPEDAKRLAELLHDADLFPSSATATTVWQALSKRDLLKVAKGEAAGRLEKMLLRTLCLKTELTELTREPQYLSFKLKLKRDLDEISAVSANLGPSLNDYFDAQEQCVPNNVTDIDAYIEANIDTREIKELGARRQQLQKLCSDFHYRLCLITSLLVYGTKGTPDKIGETLKKVGFQVEVVATPAWDWNTITLIALAIFTTLLAINVALLFLIFLGKIDNDWSRLLTRSTMLWDALIDTIPFGIVILAAIRMKRWWFTHGRNQSENLLSAVGAFIIGTLYYLVTDYISSGRVSAAPLLLAATPCVAGYFVGVYVDRSMGRQSHSPGLTLLQAAAQGVAAVFGIYFLINFADVMQNVYILSYAGLEAAAVGLVIGFLFQRHYQPTELQPQDSQGKTVKIVADLVLKLKGMTPSS